MRAPDALFRRWEEDILIQIGLARFFAAKLQAALLWRLHERTGSAGCGSQALAIYIRGREAWSAMAERAQHVYGPDINFGREAIVQRGHWIDRLPDIDRDIAAMRAAVGSPIKTGGAVDPAAVLDPRRPSYTIQHHAPDRFVPGQPLALAIASSEIDRATLFYRHVNQAERWRSLAMSAGGAGHAAAIPADYTASRYPLQYYFQLEGAGGPTLAPGFGRDWVEQPYHSVWRRDAG